jgi:hypothetical protein
MVRSGHDWKSCPEQPIQARVTGTEDEKRR